MNIASRYITLSYNIYYLLIKRYLGKINIDTKLRDEARNYLGFLLSKIIIITNNFFFK